MQGGQPTPTNYLSFVMVVMRICSVMNSIYVVVLLITWQDVQLHVSTERSVNPPCSLFDSTHLTLCILEINFPSIKPIAVLQGTGRYAIYVANYAQGRVGPHVLLEMDEPASDLSKGVIALSNVAAEAGVNKLTG